MDGLAVPVEAEPAQHVEDVVGQLGPVALCVGVLDPQEERSAVRPREQPVAQRGVRRPDVQVARRRRREPAPVSVGHRSLATAASRSGPSRSSSDLQLGRRSGARSHPATSAASRPGPWPAGAHARPGVPGARPLRTVASASLRPGPRAAVSSRKPHIVNATIRSWITGARPKSDARFDAIGRQPWMASSSAHRSARYEPVVHPAGQARARSPGQGPGLPKWMPRGCPVVQVARPLSPATARAAGRRLVRAHVVHRLDGHIFGRSHLGDDYRLTSDAVAWARDEIVAALSRP